jgi:tetratricopeptide (TPR) repeat protein
MKAIVWLLVLTATARATTKRRRIARGGALPPAWLLKGGAEATKAHSLKAKADAAQRADKYKDAVSLYEKALEDSSGDDLLEASIRLNLARCHLKLEQDVECIEVCDAVVDKVSSRSPLRATALYRRACAKRNIGELGEAYVDAKTAQSLGHERAFEIVDACAEHAPPEPPQQLLPLRTMQSAGGAKKALEGLLEDPSQARKLVPLAKTLGSASTLKNVLNLPAERAEKLAAALQDLDEDRAEKWARRAKRAVGAYRGLRKFSRLWRRYFPKTVYAGVLYLFGTDSLRLLRQKD